MDNGALSRAPVKHRLNWKRCARILGNLFAIIGIAFVSWRLASQWQSVNDTIQLLSLWPFIASATIIYAFANLLLALAWHNQLFALGFEQTRLWSAKVYGVSQIAKYIPGNVFQYVSRYSIGVQDGLSGGLLIKSTFSELLSLAFAAATLGWFLPALLWSSDHLWLCALAATATFLAGYGAASRLVRPLMARALLMHAAFHVVAGSLFVAGLQQLDAGGMGNSGYGALGLAGVAYVLAWLAGFVVPGSPAGLGIREVVLLYLLAGRYPEATLLVVILACRIVTTLGDILFYLVALTLPNGEAANR
ncbi:MAG: hypothetical protein LCH46_11600 [Proteobacteria bacterium]|nr:hypothetical protein [Pseudomonadota bacterium]